MAKSYFRHKIAAIAGACPLCGYRDIPLTQTKNGRYSLYCEGCMTRYFINTDQGVESLRDLVGLAAYSPALEDAAHQMADEATAALADNYWTRVK